jgi:ATP-binding cassette, sub-family E, member 1
MSSFRSKSSKASKKGGIRIAIIDRDRCRPEKCGRECLNSCPVNRQGRQCVEIGDIEDGPKKKKIAKISADLCIGCGICPKVCPFNAIQIVNLPSEIESDLIHSYGENSFKLYRFPIPKKGKVVGFIGQNGIGKSTIMGLLSGKVRPNFGKIPLEDTDILKNFRGSELQPYLRDLYQNELRVKAKPQHVDKLLKKLKRTQDRSTVQEIVTKHHNVENEFHNEIVTRLGLDLLSDSTVANLSGGELQRLICATTLMTEADVYIFDEPSNFLDIHYRMVVAELIGLLVDENRYVFVVEHDMSILDYTCDSLHIIYGQPGAYGVVSSLQSTASGINTYFDGYIATDNVRFRAEPYNFKDRLTLECEPTDGVLQTSYEYEEFEVSYDQFKLRSESGKVSTSSLIVLAGRNGMGKTTFLNHINDKYSDLIISYKPQYLTNSTPDQSMSVRDYLYSDGESYITDPMFRTDVLNSLEVGLLFDRNIKRLSGGELQRVIIAKALSRKANIYLIDEPSACLDVEQRVQVTKAIKRFTAHYHKTVFVVEHDIMMSMSMGMEATSRIIVFGDDDNESDIRSAMASRPQKFNQGINAFLKELNITFRTSTYSQSSRPRINKIGSSRDSEQKARGVYYE